MNERLISFEAKPDLEVLTSHIDLLSQHLQGWYGNKDSDSILVQQRRARDRDIYGSVLQEAVGNIGQLEGYCLRLTVGEKSVKAYRFVRGPHGIYSLRSRTIEPWSEIIIESAQNKYLEHHPDVPQPSGLFPKDEMLAGGAYQIPISSIARTLCQDGSLEIVAVPPDEN